jgi:N-acetylglucosamine-6-phosphate deacetylase
VIADGCHLPTEILKMVYRIKGPDRVALVCDSMRCAGENVKESILGSLKNGQRVIVEDEVAKLPDRSAFAGSVATDDRLVRVMWKQCGIPLQDCIRMMSLTPAKIMGINDQVGSITVGKKADLICFDENVKVEGVMAGGKIAYGSFGREGRK